MGVPRNRGTRSRTGQRRFQKRLRPVTNVRACPQCKAPVPPHRKCAFCGYFKK